MSLTYEEVKTILVHRFPFLMVDKVLDYELGKTLVALKNATGNEMHFLGHFPDYAIMPGVLIVEAAAQASAILFILSKKEKTPGDERVYFSSIQKMRFLSPVVPGDQLIIRVEAVKLISNAGITNVRVCVEDKTVAKGQLSFGSPPKGVE